MGDFFIGGPVRVTRRVFFDFSHYELTPQETRAYFANQGWRTIVGFQTRNVPHRAHEYLQRLALEQADGLFIQPLVGRKQRGDFHPLAILSAYRTLIDNFLPAGRVLLGILSTAMRYAGPREALFHAIIRRNYGCTHFIIGRDHAGVGDYYGKYEAHRLAEQFDGELGIEVLRFAGPFYWTRCDGIVTERTCCHLTEPDYTRQISGTDVRAMLSQGGMITNEIMRPEVVASLARLPLFIDEDEE
jgi:sulfate adenylyltransferase